MKLTIIIPVYNTELYLKRCLDSVIAQNRNDIEAIIVDDGSTDDSGEICDTYVKNYPNLFKVIHQNNRGLSSARNTALRQAKGEFVEFLDSDDWLYEDSIGRILDQLTEDVEVIEFGYSVERNDIIERIEIPSEKGSFEDLPVDVYIKQRFINADYEWYPWKYIISRSYIENKQFKFTEGRHYEDVILIPQIVLLAKKIRVVPMLVYHYVLGRSGAITNGVKLQTEIDKLFAAEQSFAFVNRLKIEDKNLLLSNFAKIYVSAMISLYCFEKGNDRKVFYEQLIQKKYMLQFVNSGSQLLVKKTAKVLGIRLTSYLLHLRMVLKNGKKNF